MESLNYHHLFYFWNVAREGSVQRASQKLQVAQPTVSEQLHILERSFEEKLFDRVGQKLVLTEMGQLVYRYADEIFLLGREMQGAIAGRPTGRPLRLVVGLADALPKLIAYRLLEPALKMSERPQIVCYESQAGTLVSGLADHSLDLVLSNSPVEPGPGPRIHSHLIGESGVTLFARRKLAARLRPWFPRSLDGAPMLLPTPNTALRRSLDEWLQRAGIRPHVVGELEDSALLAEFGEQGDGVFPFSSAVEEDVRLHHRVEVVGRLPSIRISFYALCADRKVMHPAVALITRNARHELFAISEGSSTPS